MNFMKNFLIIVLLLIALTIGINIGGQNEQSKAEIIQDKIENFENDINDNNRSYNVIEPNALNKIADKCNNALDDIIKSVLKKIIK